MAVHDGPGIRTTFFVKGCPLQCLWCHNPESQSPQPQVARFQHLCRHCAKCTLDESTCPARALKLYGKPMSIPEIVAKAMEDKPFYDESGGGVTLSGGEPLLFPEWTEALLRAFKDAGFHVCLDTSLFAKPLVIDSLMPLVDLWLPDFKAADDTLHRRCTGVSNARVKANLERLASAGATLEVRCLSVPGLTDGADLAMRREWLHSIGIPESAIVDLPYHDMARSKYLALGMPYAMQLATGTTNSSTPCAAPRIASASTSPQ